MKNISAIATLIGMASYTVGAHASVTTASGANYALECLQAGVPLPPTWAAPVGPSWFPPAGSNWQYKGSLPNGSGHPHGHDHDIFGGSSLGHVYAYTKNTPGSEGACVALPRVETDGKVTNFGIICQSKTNGKACFWEQDLDTTWPSPTTSVVSNGNFDSGTDIAFHGCTGCHLGSNAFIYSPDTPLSASAIAFSNPNVWYEPIGPSSWSQNAKPLTTPLRHAEAEASACGTCHSSENLMPELSKATGIYCGTVLDGSWTATMPPDSNTYKKEDFQASYTFLKRQCTSVPDMAMASSAGQLLDGYLVDPSGDLYHYAYEPSTSWVWERLGNNFPGRPHMKNGIAASANSGNRRTVVGFADDGRFKRLSKVNGTWAWNDINNGFGYSLFSNPPAMAASGASRTDTFIVGDDKILRVVTQNAAGNLTWGVLSNFPGGLQFRDRIVAVADPTSTESSPKIFVVGRRSTGTNILLLTYTGSSFSVSNLGNVLGTDAAKLWNGPITATITSDPTYNHFHILGLDLNRDLRYLRLDVTTSSPAVVVAENIGLGKPFARGFTGPLAIGKWSDAQLYMWGPAYDGHLKGVILTNGVASYPDYGFPQWP